jgi:hypothetical protein
VLLVLVDLPDSVKMGVMENVVNPVPVVVSDLPDHRELSDLQVFAILLNAILNSLQTQRDPVRKDPSPREKLRLRPKLFRPTVKQIPLLTF